MRFLVWLVVALGPWLVAVPVAEGVFDPAHPSTRQMDGRKDSARGRADRARAPNPTQLETEFNGAVQRGIEAFRRGYLDVAARAFQRAYLIRPNDPKLQSWLALVRDEQLRREAMTFALEDVQYVAPAPAPEVEEEQRPSRPPLWKRLFLPKHVPLGFDAGVTPVDEGRLEIREAGVRAGFQRLYKAGVTPVEEGRPEILEAGVRAGFQRLYKEGIGFQPIPGFGVSTRTEIFEEPNPVDDYILEAKILNLESVADFRRSITPLFTRSAATRFVTDIEPWPRLTYEFDYRDVFHEFQTRFNFKHRDFKTHSFNALYTLPPLPLLGELTVNPWYKRIIRESNTDLGSFENVDEFLLNLSLRSSENVEYFLQYDTNEASKQRTVGASKLQLFKGQVRMRFPQWRLFVIPSYEYSVTTFDPGDDEFSKRDLFVDWGFDITQRLRASSKQQYIIGHLSQAGKSPSNPEARSFTTENTLSYELFKDFDVSFGLDYSKGIGLNAYNNVGFRTEAEFFRPGILRAKVGYEWLSYYNIDDSLSLLFVKIFLFQ